MLRVRVAEHTYLFVYLVDGIQYLTSPNLLLLLLVVVVPPNTPPATMHGATITVSSCPGDSIGSIHSTTCAGRQTARTVCSGYYTAAGGK